MLRGTFARRIALQVVAHSDLRHCRCRQIPLHPLPITPFSRRLTSSTTNTSHDSLSSFLKYADRTHLDRSSTTFTGTYYEYVTQTLLRRYGFNLTRVGGRGDRGVDLKGTWTILTSPTTPGETDRTELELPTIIQCKRLKTKVGPNLIRELEGALASSRKSNTLGVLVGTKGATKGLREAMARSKLGICWIMLEVGETNDQQIDGRSSEISDEDGEEVEVQQEEKEDNMGFDGILQNMKEEIVSKAPSPMRNLLEPEKETEDNAASSTGETELDTNTTTPPAVRDPGRVRQMLWNRSASELGLEGLDVVMKFDGATDANGEPGKEVTLKWQGKPIVGL